MAFVSANPLYQGRSGSKANDERTWESAWLVEMSDPADNMVDVLNAMTSWLGQPLANLGNGQDVEAICKRLVANQVPDSRLFWIVTGSWEVPTLNIPSQQDPNGNPTDDPTEWRDQVEVVSNLFMAPVEKAKLLTDLSGVDRAEDSLGPVINAAGEIYDPAPEREDSHKIYRITKFLKTYNSVLYDAYDNAINSDSLVIEKPGLSRRFSPFTLKMAPINGSLNWHTPQSGPSVPYWKVVFEMHHNKDGWFTEIVNRGNARRARSGDPDGKGGEISEAVHHYVNGVLVSSGIPRQRRIVDDEDNPLGIVLLDLGGQPLEPGAEATYIKYGFYTKELAFSALNI